MTLASQSRYFIRKATPNGCLVSDPVDFQIGIHRPSKNALAKSCKKRSFFLHSSKILKDLAGSCEILQESCCKILARFRQNNTRSCRNARKKDLFLQDLATVGSIIAIMSCCSEKIGPLGPNLAAKTGPHNSQ